MTKEKYSYNIPSSKCIGFKLLFLFLFNAVYPTYSQVYNYSPIRYSDIETNPSILASSQKNNQINISHQNSFSSSDNFSNNNLSFSKYFESHFFGVGLMLNNTEMRNNINYNYVGLGVGYRNVLFNKLYVKIGATYKMLNANSSGSFEYYTFNPSGKNQEKRFSDNLNLSIAFCSASDRYFISMSLLNSNLPWNKTNDYVQFPKYYVLHVGNFMRFFNGGGEKSQEISYTAIGKITETNQLLYSHYIDIKLHSRITRKSSLQYGSRVGYSEEKYFHCIPFITYFRRKIALTFSYNAHFEKKDFKPNYPSTTQFNLLYNF